MPDLELEYTLFCEDVRFEASNHLSLMGVTHQVVVPRLPITVIKFAVITHWRGEGQYLSEVRILTPDRMQTVAVSQPGSFVVPADGYSDNVTVFVNLNIFQAGQSCRSGTGKFKCVRGAFAACNAHGKPAGSRERTRQLGTLYRLLGGIVTSKIPPKRRYNVPSSQSHP